MKLHFDTDTGIGTAARMGLIVLEADETLEPEFTLLNQRQDISIYHNRIKMATQITPQTLAAMEAELPLAAGMFPDCGMDVIGYGCTSAATVIGPARVKSAIQKTQSQAKVTEPLSALIAACNTLGLKKIGFLTPYVPEVSKLMIQRLEEAGISITGFASFEESDDRVVARISPNAILNGIKAVATAGPCDGVIAACTNLRVVQIAKQAEAEIAMPVLSSNLALAWHMMHLVGIDPKAPEFGTLMAGSSRGAHPYTV